MALVVQAECSDKERGTVHHLVLFASMVSYSISISYYYITSRNPQQCCGDHDHACSICAVSLPVHKTLLQLARLAKFMKEQTM